MKSETAQGYERGTMLLPGAVSQTGRNSNFRLDSLIRVIDLDSLFKSVR